MSAQPLGINLVPTLGAMLIGDLISVTMYGLTTAQAYFYFQGKGRSDKPLVRLFVFFIWLLETVHAFLVGAYLFNSLIVDAGNFPALLTTKISDDVVTQFTALIIVSVHLFYARRLWILSEKNVLLVSVVVILAVLNFGFEMAVMALTFKYRAFSEFHARDTPYFVAALALAAADDILIAASMTVILNRKRSGWKSTDTLVNKIVLYSIATGAITSVFDILILVCYLAMPNNLVYLCMFNFINNLYANSLLAMLNARDSFNKRPGHSSGLATSLALTDFQPSSTSSHPNSNGAFLSTGSKLVFARSQEQESIMMASSKPEGEGV
ncbi:hypothetical protein OF83DRAFT_770714 [Amylostereum chailletii]|nr:hypothetical protein OF83DRAFT_770714 [Amylostereum chailletii]